MRLRIADIMRIAEQVADSPVRQAIIAYWDAAVGRAAPALETSRDWVGDQVRAIADWLAPAIQAWSEALRPYLAIPLAAAGPHWPEIAVAGTGVLVIAVIALSTLRSRRRRRQLDASLIAVTLSYNQRTGWFELAINMRNLQSSALIVRSIQVIKPAGAKICELWQAWQPTTNGVRFVAPELQLTDSVSIERTILPYGSSSYAGFGSSLSRPTKQIDRSLQDNHGVSPSEELIRRFYVLPRDPASRRRTVLQVRLICELQTRRPRWQELTFRRTLPPVELIPLLDDGEAAATNVSDAVAAPSLD
jgi:hypothetical protein